MQQADSSPQIIPWYFCIKTICIRCDQITQKADKRWQNNQSQVESTCCFSAWVLLWPFCPLQRIILLCLYRKWVTWIICPFQKVINEKQRAAASWDIYIYIYIYSGQFLWMGANSRRIYSFIALCIFSVLQVNLNSLRWRVNFTLWGGVSGLAVKWI